MAYYTQTTTFTKGSRARAALIDAEFAAIEAAFVSAEGEIDDTIRFTNADLTAALTSSANAATRADKLLGFDSTGGGVELKAIDNSVTFGVADASKVIQVASAGDALELGGIPASEFVELVNPGTGTTIDLTTPIASGYDYEINIGGIDNDGADFILQAQLEVDSTLRTSGYEFIGQTQYSTGIDTNSGASASAIDLFASTQPAMGTSGSAQIKGRILIVNPGDTGSLPQIIWDLSYMRDAGVDQQSPCHSWGGGTWITADGAITNLRLLLDTGNFVSNANGIIVRRTKRS